MKKHFLLFLALWMCGLTLFAKHVPVDSARVAAYHFLQKLPSGNPASRSMTSLRLVHQEISSSSSSSFGSRTAALTYYYVFELADQNGLVFVSADDKVTPILGYTSKGSYNPENMPPHFRKWLEVYKNEIRFAIQEQAESKKPSQAWTDLLQGASTTQKSNTRTTKAAAGPLLSTTWDQSPYYNDLCPYDSDAGELTVSGCVATAMAQIMKYWNYPAQGSGFHSYNHEKYGTLSANFSNTTYDWNNMPTKLNGPNQAVATLMKHIGVSVDMGYDVAENGGSGAYVISAGSPVEHCSEYALKTYFGYTGVQGKERENYTLTAWTDLLMAEINAGRPVLYAGYGGGGGHAFVCDGYDDSGNFHMNWGWGGYYDGFYAISALDPGGVGTGGGTGGYNSGQQAVIGIEAPETPNTGDGTAKMELLDDVTVSLADIFYGEGFSVSADIINNGTATFKGDLGAAAFDENGNFVEWIQIYTGNELQANNFFDDAVFTTEGLLTLLPGSYSLGVFYKSGTGQWEQLKGESFVNFVIIKVTNDNAISLSSALAVQEPAKIYQGKPISVTSSVNNKDVTSFNGLVDVSLYTLDGEHVFSVEDKELTALCAGCDSGSITFGSENLDVAPGTYLLAMLHMAEGTEEWELTGSVLYSNPVKVIVQVAPLETDIYENNDEVDKAYALPLDFAENATSLQVTTPGSGIHVGTDYDYYKFTLPEGFTYGLDVQVYDSNTGNAYTNDVLFSVWDGAVWSDAFDDVMPAAVEAEGGNTVYVYVSPYFQGETGTYLLEVNIQRETPVEEPAPTGVGEDFPVEVVLNAYPNPTSGLLNIRSKKPYENAVLTSLTGQVLQELPANTTKLDISGLAQGVYLLKIRSREGYQVQKIIKE